MLNTPEFYRDLGVKSAQARNQHDEARASFHAEHFRKARDLEQGKDREDAAHCYKLGYESERVVPNVERFK